MLAGNSVAGERSLHGPVAKGLGLQSAESFPHQYSELYYHLLYAFLQSMQCEVNSLQTANCWHSFTLFDEACLLFSSDCMGEMEIERNAGGDERVKARRDEKY